MTIEYPLARTALADVLGYMEVKMWLDLQQEVSGDGHGNYWPAGLAPAIWRGQMTLDDTLTHEEADDIEAIFDSLDGAFGSFFMPDPRRLFPRSDPGGSIIRPWATPVTITDIADNNKEVKLAGLPPLYKLSRGDRCAYPFGSNPTHRAYHRLMNTIEANGDGETGWVELRPYLIDGAVNTGTVVNFDRACAQWMIPPKGREVGTGRRTLTPGGTIAIQQVL
jgi:hypothetical protein